jgi:flavodoxin
MPGPMPRRAFLRLGLAGVGVLSACGPESGDDARPEPTRAPRPAGREGRILLAYFSRPGENWWNGGRRNLEVGNTEVLARTIAARLDCDVHRIEAADPYPAGYDATVERNVREQDTDARPAIADPLGSIDGYETILLGSPIWNIRAPMIMSTFVERFDFAGRTVHPVTTYAMSGLGTTPEDYARECRGARIGAGLAVQGQEARSAGADVDAWLRRTGLSGES